MSIAATIGRNVKHLRTQQGLTQKVFAERVGVSTFTIIAIERSKPTSFEVMEKIAEAFRVCPAELLTADPTWKPLFESIDAEPATVDAFKSLPPYKQTIYQTLAAKMDGVYGQALEEAHDEFRERIVSEIETRIDLIDPEGKTAYEVKRAAHNAVRNTTTVFWLQKD